MKLIEQNLHNLVARIAKALSLVTSIKWQLHVINNKPLKFAIINENTELLFVPRINEEDEVYTSDGRIFDSYEKFLTRIISTKFPLKIFDSTGKKTEFIFSERFGKTLDELNIKLDMLNI